MTDNLDDVFTGITRSITAAALPPGSQAARARGRQRAGRKRITAGTLALVLVAGAAGIAAASTDPDGTPLPAASHSATPQPTPTTSPTTTRSPSASPEPPTSAPAAGAPGSGPSLPNSSSSPTAGLGTLSTPGQIAAAWLTPDQMPDNADFNWSPWHYSANPINGDNWGVAPCASLPGNMTAWLEEFYNGSSSMTAIQQTYLYPSATDAQQGFPQSISTQDCQAQYRSLQSAHQVTPDAVVTLVATSTDAFAWTISWTGVNTPPTSAGPQTDFVYLAMVGNAISFLQFKVPALNAQSPPSSDAAAVLNAMTQDLAAYNTGS